MDDLTAYHRLIEREAAQFGVRIMVQPHLHDFAEVDRGGWPNRIFVPQPGGQCLSILAVLDGEIVASWACTAFDTGHENLSEFLHHATFYPGGGADNWFFREEALRWTRKMTGTMVYCGGLWVKPEHRGEGRLGRWWSKNVGLLGRSIMEDRIQPDWYWLMSDFGGVAEKVAHHFGLKQLRPTVEWSVEGVLRDGKKVLGVQDRNHLTQSVRARLER